MWAWLLKKATKIVKGSVVNPIKKFTNGFKGTRNAIAKKKFGEFVQKGIAKKIVNSLKIPQAGRLTKLVRGSRVKKAKKSDSAYVSVRGASTPEMTNREKVIATITTRAELLEQIQTASDEIATGHGATVPTTELSKDINKNVDILKIKTDEELEDIKATIDDTLKDLGVDLRKKDLTEDEFNNLASENAFQAYVDQWKSKFFDSGTDNDGNEFTYEEKVAIWEQNEAERIPNMRKKFG